MENRGEFEKENHKKVNFVENFEKSRECSDDSVNTK